MLVFGFFIMILGTYANLGAIDEQQSGANMPIDRLPDIHVPQPTENIFITPSKMDNLKNKIEMGPANKPINADFESVARTKTPKRKIIKATKLPLSTETIREINLNKVEKDELQPVKPQPKIPIVPINVDNTKIVEPKIVQSAPKPAELPKSSNTVPSQLAEPSIDKKTSDSVINNEAIQKENLEMEIDAKESRQNDVKITKEILDEVKSQLSKQNEINQKEVLAKIQQISEKVNDIAQMQDRTAAQTKDISQPAHEVQKPVANEKNVENEKAKPSIAETVKNLPLPAVPVAKLLVDRQSSTASSQANVISEPEHKETKSNTISVPESPGVVKQSVGELPETNKKLNENVGRDLLSNSNNDQTDNAKSSNIKTEQ